MIGAKVIIPLLGGGSVIFERSYGDGAFDVAHMQVEQRIELGTPCKNYVVWSVTPKVNTLTGPFRSRFWLAPAAKRPSGLWQAADVSSRIGWPHEFANLGDVTASLEAAGFTCATPAAAA